jgi:hypothetical protein
MNLLINETDTKQEEIILSKHKFKTQSISYNTHNSTSQTALSLIKHEPEK